ncbi:MAG: peptidase S41, partial [Rhodospirillaceae bacterium]|nr:peptidase S41 [Rhodospirillaceae bacterium]
PIVTLSGRHAGAKQFYAARAGDIADGKPLVLMVDGKSASSAEITAAALVDNGRAITVGTNTLGKGSVQTLIRLPNDGEIALTWAEVVSPGGYRVHGLGLLPTICTANYDGSLPEVVTNVQRRQTPWRALPEGWRTAERTADNIGALRGLCPAQSRADEQNDQALAIRMAADQALYAQASSPSIAASR